jgi:hypothetical protein
MLLFTGLHVIGLVLVVALLVMFLRSDTVRPWSPPGDQDGGGEGGEEPRPSRPEGPGGDGLPLPDARPGSYRLRDHLRPRRPAPARRRSREPRRIPVSSPPRARSGR